MRTAARAEPAPSRAAPARRSPVPGRVAAGEAGGVAARAGRHPEAPQASPRVVSIVWPGPEVNIVIQSFMNPQSWNAGIV